MRQATLTTASVWVDANSLALGAAVEVDGEIVEDFCFPRPNKSFHITMVEMYVALKDLNLTVTWAKRPSIS